MRTTRKLSFPLVLGFLVACAPLRAQLLWEIRHDSLARPSYLFGTIHLADPRVLAFDSVVYEKFDACDAMAGEVLFDQSSILKSLNLFMLPKGTELADLYADTADYRFVKKSLRKTMGMYAAMAERFKPILLVFMIQSGELDAASTNPGEVLDVRLQALAKQKGKTLLEVESIAEQMGSLDEIPLEEQAQMLLSAARQAEDPDYKPGDTFEDLIEIYLSQDLEGMLDYTEQSEEASFPSFGQALLDNRNPRMAARIAAMVRRQPTFVAIGSAHLGGPGGVIELLRAEGFELTPVPFAFHEPLPTRKKEKAPPKPPASKKKQKRCK